MSQAPLRRSELSLADIPNCVYWARLHLVDVLTQWGVPSEVIQKARLIVSELATNAVTHASRKDGTPLSYLDLETVNIFTIELELFAGLVRVLVWDRDPTPPQLKVVGLEETSGRGVFLVDAMSQRWGHFPACSRSGVQGKVVWGDIALAPTAGSASRTRAAPARQGPRAEEPGERRSKESPPSAHRVRPAPGEAAHVEPSRPVDPFLVGNVLVGLRRL